MTCADQHEVSPHRQHKKNPSHANLAPAHTHLCNKHSTNTNTTLTQTHIFATNAAHARVLTQTSPSHSHISTARPHSRFPQPTPKKQQSKPGPHEHMPNMSLHNAHPTTEYKPLVKKEKRKHDATESAQLQPLSHSLMQKNTTSTRASSPAQQTTHCLGKTQQ